MPSNSEMYERGALDAEHDDLNPFYYQHYYYYRKGYDEARRQLRRPAAEGRPATRAPLLILLAALLGLGVAGGYWLLSRGPQQGAASAAAPTSSVIPTARPTARPLPTPTIQPSPSPAPELAVGRRARVVTQDGSPLRMRAAPGQGAGLVARAPAGSEVELLEGPVEVDGLVWWRIRASDQEGWSAARTSDGATIFLEPLP